MSRDFLNDSNWDTSITHLGQGSTPKAMGTDSFYAYSLTGFAKNPISRARMNVSLAVSASKEIAPGGGRFKLVEPDAQVFNHRNGASCQLAFGVPFTNHDCGADSFSGVKNILDVEGNALVDATGSVETDGKEGAISIWVEGKPFVKE